MASIGNLELHVEHLGYASPEAKRLELTAIGGIDRAGSVRLLLR